MNSSTGVVSAEEGWPPGLFDLILADPPWQYRYALPSVGQNIEGRHYDCLPLPAIAAMPVASSAAKDAILLLWSVSPKLPEALEVMQAWGFSYRQQLVWEKLTPKGKPNHGMGHWLKGNHETLLLGIKGSPRTPPDRKKRPPSVFRAARRAHSQKPDEVYTMIEGMFPHLPLRLELFATAHRPGWTSWGRALEMEAAR